MQNKKETPPTKDLYPMRINKYLARKGVSTRVGVDELIKSKKILINGKLATLGDKVTEKDKVEVRGIHNKKQYVYFAYNKPKGIVSTNPQRDEEGIMDKLITLPKLGSGKKLEGVFPIGRLDKESTGLMILTNDGRVTDRLLNPIYDHEKEYIVKVDRKYTPGFIRNMENGVDLGEEITKPAILRKINEDTFSITLTEGRNRQIRRMTEKLGYTVRELKRIRVQNIELKNLPENSVREITNEEKTQFLKGIGLE